MYAVKNIAEFIDSTAETKIRNLVPGRRFTFTLSGFNTGRNVSVSALSTIQSFVTWKNAPSILSYQTYDIASICSIKKLSFKRAHDTNTNVENSVSNLEGGVIYENGSFNLKFEVRIPRAQAGILRITHDATSNNIFSFFASTCDFSADGVSDDNLFGIRKVCHPTYNNYKSTSASTTTNLLYKNAFENSAANDSAFDLNMEEITSTSRDLVFSVWGYANKCSDEDSNGKKNDL